MENMKKLISLERRYGPMEWKSTTDSKYRKTHGKISNNLEGEK